MQTFRGTLLSCMLLSGVLAAELLAGGFNYRYRDDAGNLRISYSVPPEFVGNGYEVLDDRGMVVDVVLPQSVLDERAGKMLAEAKRRHQQELQSRKDEALLRFYSSAEDVERVRERKLGEFDTFVEIQKSNILTNRKRLAELQSQAADIELSGQKVPEKILNTLDTLEQKIGDAIQSIELKNQEKKRVWLAFELDIERLSELLGETNER